MHTQTENQSQLEKVSVCDLLVLLWCNQHCGQYGAHCALTFIFPSSVYTSSFRDKQQHHLKRACGCATLQALKCFCCCLFSFFFPFFCENSTTDCLLSSWPLCVHKQLRIQFSLWTQARLLFLSSQRWYTLIWSLLMQVQNSWPENLYIFFFLQVFMLSEALHCIEHMFCLVFIEHLCWWL